MSALGALRRQFHLRWDLRGRLLALAMLPVLVFAVVWGGYVVHERANDLQGQLQQRAQLLARQMAVAADYGIFSHNLAALQNLTLAVSKEPAVVAATIYGLNQEVLATNRLRESSQPGSSSSFADLMTQFTRQGKASVTSGRGQRISYLEPVHSPMLTVDDIPESGQAAPGPIVNGYAVVEVSTQSIAVDLWRYGLTVFGLLVGVLASSWLIVRRFSSRIDHRIQIVALAAQHIGQGQVGIRLGSSDIGVFDRLSHDLNRMAERLEQSRFDLEQRVEQATVAMREQRDTAERANSAKTRFLAAASHDLRQPMHALNLLLAALKQEQSAQSRAELLLRIEATSQAMSGLLDALLDISRLDAGGVTPHIETFELLPLLLRIHDTYEGLAQSKDIDFYVRPCKFWVQTDPMLLQRIVGNLVSNAIRYTPVGGRVVLAVRPHAQHCLLQVRDNGPGIAAQYQQAIFEEFVQIHNPQRDRSQGLGLGLAIVQRLAHLLHHPIDVRSCPGHGATFSIQLPAAPPLASNATVLQDASGAPLLPAPGDSVGSVRFRILLVEDDTMVRESYETLLQLWGCDVRSHPSAQDALAQLDEGNWAPQIIISDYRLGAGIDGLELIAVIRQRLGLNLPAALITGNTEDSALRQHHDNIIRVLFKPVKPALLMQTLNELRPLAPRSVRDAVVD